MMDALIRFTTERPRWIYLGVVVLTAMLGAQLPGIQIDTDPENMLRADQPDRVFHNEVKETFALHDALVLGIVAAEGETVYTPQNLGLIHRLTDGILGIDGVIRRDLASLSTVDNIEQAGPGTVSFAWLMPESPTNAMQAGAVDAAVSRLPMFVDTLVSGDKRAAAIYVPIESKDQSHRIAMEIEALVAADPVPGVDVHITGLPVAEDTFGFEMFVQMGISAPLAALVIFLLMWFFFRSARLVVAPMIVAMATVIATMGLLIGFGFTVHIMSSMIPIFLMPIAVVDSVHLMSEFADRYEPGRDRRAVLHEVVGHLFRPMLFTSITSAAGFASLALTPIPPVQVFGIYIALGIGLAFILTILFIPAYISRMPEASLVAMQEALHRDDRESLLARALRGLGALATARRGLILVIGLVVFAVSVAGITRIQINDNPVRWFKSDHRIRVADRVLNEHFAGTYDAYLVLDGPSSDAAVAAAQASLAANASGSLSATISEALDSLAVEGAASERLDRAINVLDDALWNAEGDDAVVLESLVADVETLRSSLGYFLQPEALAEIDRLQQLLLASGHVGKTTALTDLVRTVNRELLSGDPIDFRIPDSSGGVAQALMQFQSSHRPHDLWRMVTPDYGRTVIWLQLRSGDNQDMSAVIEALDAALEQDPLPDGVSAQWAGKTFINVVWQNGMVNGMAGSLASAFVIVLIMMVVLFRSVLFGLLAMLPLTLTISFIYGLIGWLGKDYDMPIAVLSALTLGLSVDFAIHFLDRSRTIFAENHDFAATMRAMFEEPGRAIARNAIVIAIGFLPLLFAPLVPYITVGFFLAAIMAVSALVTLLILPATASLMANRLYPDTRPGSRISIATRQGEQT